MAFEQAEQDVVFDRPTSPLNFAVIGGGPTGVELAGAIAGVARQALAGDFRSIDTTKARVMLFEGSDRVLGTFPEELSASARRQLEELGVEVKLNSLVTDVESERILVNGDWVPVRATIWATGVAASPLGKLLGPGVDKAGRVPVNQDLSLPGRPEVFVIGDMSTLKDSAGQIVPGLGAAAMQEGRHAAANILKDIAGQPRVAFKYHDKGSMATIGRNRAVATIGRFKMSGFVAWLSWAAVHVVLLIGFRNKLSVLWEWGWSYLTFQSTAGLITDPPRLVPPEAAESSTTD